MKQIITYKPGKIFLICLLAVFAASCESDADMDESDSLPILLSGKMAKGDTQSRALITDGQPLPGGLDVGVYVSDEGSGSPLYSNLYYQTDAMGALVLQTGETQPYFPANGGRATINAYYPRNNETNEVSVFEVKTNQNTDINYTASNLLYSTGAYPHNRSAISLTFNYKMACITYRLIKGNGMTDTEISQAKATVTNAEIAVDFNRATGEVITKSGQKTEIIPHSSNAAIIPPQTFSAGTNILRVNIGSNNYYVKAPAGGWKLESGQSLNLEVTVNKTGISLNYTVNDWQDGTVNDNGGNVTGNN